MAKVFVITGPSGVGKGTLISELMRRIPNLELSISATTRSPRQGEEDGRDYHFLSPEEFERRMEADDFLEFATYSGNRYGTLRSEVEQRLSVVYLRTLRMATPVIYAPGWWVAGPTRRRRSTRGWKRRKSSSPHRETSTTASSTTTYPAL